MKGYVQDRSTLLFHHTFYTYISSAIAVFNTDSVKYTNKRTINY